MPPVIKSIRTRGHYEQERQYLFPALYGNKAVTRATRGAYKNFDRNLKLEKFKS